jgi:hypothetical protein
MTVCTNDLALCHLVENTLPAPVPKPLGNAELLVPQVIELEDERILLTAVSAWMLAEECHQKRDALGHELSPTAAGGVDVSLPVGRVVLLLVLSATWAAVIVSLAL